MRLRSPTLQPDVSCHIVIAGTVDWLEVDRGSKLNPDNQFSRALMVANKWMQTCNGWLKVNRVRSAGRICGPGIVNS